jgi:ATP-dependent DNA helicase DinG
MGTLADDCVRGLARVTGALPAGEDRPGQREMTEAVARAITDRRHLLVQAGTGTGKTLAYLIPAVLSGKRTVVATATLALQDQLVTRDLPALRRVLDQPFSYAVLKGRSNYLCLQRAAETAGGTDQLELVPDRSRAEVRQLVAWALTSGSGDRAELPVEPSPAAWSAVSVSARDCPGARRCSFGGSCFAERARQAAADVDVLVVNTHLYSAHLAAGGTVLPEHELVVLDEAHTLEDVVAQAAAIEVSPGRLRALRSAVAGVVHDDALAEDIAGAADLWAVLLTARAAGRQRRLLPPLDGDVAEGIVLTRTRVEKAHTALMALPEQPSGDDPTGQWAGRRLRAITMAAGTLSDLDTLAALGEGQVAWVDGAISQPVLRLAPVDVGPLLGRTLWGAKTAVLTSATLPASLAGRLGLTHSGTSWDRLDVGSPFSYPDQALLYCATHLPDPRHDTFEAASLVEIERLIAAAGGRALVLFTSWRAMTEAARYLSPRLPWRVMTQADLPKPALLEAFAADETSCLFATAGFFQGVDVPGPALSLVVLDRLPFPRPDDPLQQARREAAGNGFAAVDLPHAATQLAQAAGRLIRSRTDVGAVAVLDRRLSTARSYRWELVNALPPFRRTGDPEVALGYLRAIRASREAASA